MSTVQRSTNCSSTAANSTSDVLVYAAGGVIGVGILLCVASVALAACLGLHRRPIYRLAMYQVGGAISYGTTAILDVIQLLLMEYHSKERAINAPLCLFTAYLNTYSTLINLFFTVITTVHLFLFVVFYKDMKRLEIGYILASLVLPAVIAAVPFATKTYGQQLLGQPWCWIVLDPDDCSYYTDSHTVSIVEVFTLWLGTALLALLVVSSLVAVMFCVLAWRVRRRSRGFEINKVIIRQMLPLVGYPISYCVLVSALVGRYVYDSLRIRHRLDETLDISDQAVNAGFVWTAGLYFLLHILVVGRTKRRRGLAIAPPRREDSDTSSHSRIINTAGDDDVTSQYMQ